MKAVYIIGIILFLAIVGIAGYYQLSNNTSAPAQNSTTSTTSQATNSTGSIDKSYTLADISSHSTKDDCWMAIEGEVYDVTKYISSHPGGDDILMGCGKDATAYFNNRPGEGTPHPKKARDLLPQFLIGTLKQ